MTATVVNRPVADPAALVRKQARAATRKALGASLLTFLLTLVGVTVLWQLALWFSDLSPYVAKGPVDVWNFFFVESHIINRNNIRVVKFSCQPCFFNKRFLLLRGAALI